MRDRWGFPCEVAGETGTVGYDDCLPADQPIPDFTVRQRQRQPEPSAPARQRHLRSV